MFNVQHAPQQNQMFNGMHAMPAQNQMMNSMAQQQSQFNNQRFNQPTSAPAGGADFGFGTSPVGFSAFQAASGSHLNTPSLAPAPVSNNLVRKRVIERYRDAVRRGICLNIYSQFTYFEPS